MIPLNQRALTALHAGKNIFNYDRSQVRAGIVHLSVGNFHRAHQAWYIDQLLSHSGNTHWGICGVGLLMMKMSASNAMYLRRRIISTR